MKTLQDERMNGSSRTWFRLGMGLCLLLCASSALAEWVSPGPLDNPVPAPLRAAGMAVADLNGDGALDMAVVSPRFSCVTVLLKDAPWPGEVHVKTGRWPIGVVAGDFDNDGDADLAVTLQNEGRVAIFTNNGTASFTRTGLLATGRAPQAIAAADMDRDGWLDLVVAQAGQGTITVLGNTAGSFAVRQTIPLPLAIDGAPAGVSCEPTALVVADLNGDTWPDVAAACAADDTAKTLISTAGTLSLAGIYPAGPYPMGITAADLNGDGQLDLAVADSEAPQVTVLLADALIGYQAQEVFLLPVPYAAFASPVGVAAVDVDADGDLDLLAAEFILLNDGAATFAVTPVESEWGDVNLDRIFTIATVPGDAGVFLGTAYTPERPGYLWQHTTATVTYYPPAAALTQLPLTADINTDGYVNIGDLQMLVASWGSSQGDAGYQAAADLNSDKAVNVGDLQILVGSWGASR